MNGVIGGSHVSKNHQQKKRPRWDKQRGQRLGRSLQVMNSVQVFTNEDFGSVRALTIDSAPWFVAKDVCDALGIRTDTVRSILDDDEVDETNPDTIGVAGGRAPLIITEAGLYSLVLRSRKPEAKRFRRWVTHEVLPSIRNHGVYATPQTIERTLYDAINAGRLAALVPHGCRRGWRVSESAWSEYVKQNTRCG